MKLIDLFVAVSDEEKRILDTKYKNLGDLKQFLDKQLNRAILLECEKIENQEQVS